MGVVEQGRVVEHVRIRFDGCDYTTSLGEAIKQELATTCANPIIRGQLAPAAGVGLNADLVITVATGVASGLIAEAVIALIKRIKKVSVNTIHRDCHMKCVTVESERCDLKIGVNGGAGMSDAGVDYGLLISEMLKLCEIEQDAGRTVIEIDVPCDLVPCGDSFQVRNVGIGSFSLWRVSYQEGERWPYCLYDAANRRFMPMNDYSVFDVIEGDGVFCDFRFSDSD